MPATPTRARKTWFQRILIVVVFIVAIGDSLGFFVLNFGQVMGTEFTPDRFERRDFAYFRIPLVRLQISPVVRWDSSNDLEDHLGRTVLKQRRKPNAKRWDVASVTTGATAETGDAAILCHYLDVKNEDDELLWLKWTKEHKALAKPLWLAVHDAARLDAYVCIPELFARAESHGDAHDATEFSEDIHDYMATTLSAMAKDRESLEEFERAEQLYTAALAYSKDDAKLKARADALRRRLGKKIADPAPSEATGS